MPDHFLVKVRLQVMEECREDGGARDVLKVSELNKGVKGWAYQESLRGKYKVSRGVDGESVETEWEIFRDIQ